MPSGRAHPDLALHPGMNPGQTGGMVRVAERQLRLERRLVRLALLVLHALLGGSLLVSRHDVDHVDRTASLFNGLDRALRRAGNRELENRGQFALPEQTDAVLATACQTSGLERLMVDRGASFDLARVDRLLDRTEVTSA